MKDLSADDRPREKLRQHGAAALGDNELIALVIGNGSRRGGALSVANALLAAHGGLHGLARCTADDFVRIVGIGFARASQIVAALELGRRTLAHSPSDRIQILGPREAAAYLMPRFGARGVEQFGIVLLDSKHRVLRTAVLAIGTLNSSIVQPREVFREAAIGGAAAIVVFHKHSATVFQDGPRQCRSRSCRGIRSEKSTSDLPCRCRRLQGANTILPPRCHPGTRRRRGLSDETPTEVDVAATQPTTRNFTAEGIKALRPEIKRVDYWDTNLSGFGLRVTPSGVKTWFYWYRKDGHVKRRWTIGRYPQLSLAEARQKAREAYGKDPAGQKGEVRHAQTFGHLTEMYLRLHAKPHKKSWKKDQQRIERDLAGLKNLAVKDITRRMVQALLDKMADPTARNAPASAREIKRLLSKMFNFALPRDFAVDVNPVLGTQAPKATARQRFLLDSEIVRLVAALEAESGNGHHLMAHWFLLILLTAQRPGEVAAMRWDQLDIFGDRHERAATGWWNVRTSKNQHPIHAALSPEAVRMLRALHAWSHEEHVRIEKNCARRRGPRPMSAYVFPAGDVAQAAADAPMGTDQFPATERVRDLMGVRDWTPHDLRRTASTLMGRLKVTRFIIDRVLNHTDATVGGIYDRFTYTEERMEAVTKLGAHIASLVKTASLLPARPRSANAA